MTREADLKFIFYTAYKLIEAGWCQALAKHKRDVTNPIGEWVINPKNKQEFVFQDADSWSLAGALLRAEFEESSPYMIPENGTKSASPILLHKQLFSTPAVFIINDIVKSRGFNSLADFNDDKKTTQQDVLEVLSQAMQEK